MTLKDVDVVDVDSGVNAGLADAEINPETEFLANHAAAIRQLGGNIIQNVVEIGRRLAEVRARIDHGWWLAWLKREFGWTDRTALNFMRVHELSEAAKSENFSDLKLPVSALYLLASPSTPAEVRGEILDRARNGERIKYKDVVAARSDTKQPTPPAPPAPDSNVVELRPPTTHFEDYYAGRKAKEQAAFSAPVALIQFLARQEHLDVIAVAAARHVDDSDRFHKLLDAAVAAVKEAEEIGFLNPDGAAS